MAKNINLAKAKDAKKDEFYTQMADIENELMHYKEQFKGKTVLCNCDDPYESNFFKYFALNFNYLGLKKLITTCYHSSPIAYTQLSLFGEDQRVISTKDKKAYKVEITKVEDLNGDEAFDLDDIELLLKKKGVVKKLKGDGDFRSDECVELLKESDIVVTNPPFSLVKEYIPFLIKYDKKFLIIASMQNIKYKEIFPLILENKLWPGYSYNKTMEFIMPDSYELKGKAFIDSNGKKHGFVPGIVWLTNLDTTKRHEKIDLFKRYKNHENEYPKYDNFDCIEVKSINLIPLDYSGYMGVPISALDKISPEQFELIGSSDIPETLPGVKRLGKEWIDNYRKQGGTGHYTANMKSVGMSSDGKNKIVFSRLIIKNKNVEGN